MRALVLTSSHLRHKFLLKTIALNFDLVGAIIEDKGDYYRQQSKDSALISRHFEKLSRMESAFFESEVSQLDLGNINILSIDRGLINSEEVINWAHNLNPDIVFLFGTCILKEGWLNRFNNKIINLHLGLSPYYRGSGTLFWPFVDCKVECVGATIHLAAKQVDSGDILARIKPVITEGDTYYTINCKVIRDAILALPQVARKLGVLPHIKQKTDIGKVYLKSDFNEGVLSQVLVYYGNGISKEQLLTIQESNECDCCR